MTVLDNLQQNSVVTAQSTQTEQTLSRAVGFLSGKCEIYELIHVQLVIYFFKFNRLKRNR